MKQDKIEIEVLSDGRVKVTTAAVSAANHSSAEQAITFLQGLLGGKATITRNTAQGHHHHHTHTHEHTEHRH